jgi:putative ABC transport system permease protein
MTWRRKDEALKAELDAHLAMDVEERVARGTPRNEAIAAAQRELGNRSQIEEATRDAWGGRWLEQLAQDVRYATRVFRRNPGYALVAVLSLALGIGANTALFEVVDAIRLRTLPVADPDRLAEVHIPDMHGARGSFQSWNPPITQPIWRQLQVRQQGFDGMFVWSRRTFDVADGGEVRPVAGLWVSGDFFPTLRVQPAAGRLLAGTDDTPGCAPRVVLGYRFWQRAFGGDPGAVGRTISLDSRPVEILGVSAPTFFGLEVGRAFDVVLPLCAEPAFSEDGKGRRDAGTTWWLSVFGRLKPGWSIERASAQLAGISPAIFKASLPPNYPPLNVPNYLNFTLAAFPAASGLSQLREPYTRPLWLLLGIAGLVLVIACANLANLLLARAMAREREFAVRLSLGASRGRVIRQLLTESLLLGAVGTTCAVFIAGTLGRALVSFLSQTDNMLTLPVEADWRVIGFATLLAVVTCLLFGMAPAMKSTRLGVSAVMRTSARIVSAGREAVGLRRALVVAQVALSVTLLFGSLLFARSLVKLTSVDLGFDQNGIIALEFDARRLAIAPDQRTAFKRDMVARIRALPGIRSAASVTIVPISGFATGNSVWPAQDRRAVFSTLFNEVGTDYFKTLGIRLISGRDFDDHDGLESPRVAIISEAFAKKLPLGGPVIGSRVVREATPSTPERTFEVVGVVADSKYMDVREQASPVMFLPDAQTPAAASTQMIVRSSLAASTVTAEITDAITHVDRRLAVSYTVVADQIRDTLVSERLLATLSGGFGALAALLTLFGLYGVIAYAVTRRTNEIGVRIALGATRGHIATLLVRETGVLLAVGIAVGIMLALAAGRAAATLLFGVQPNDPVTLAAAVVALTLIAAIATSIPARRATRIEPITALRVE